MLRLPVISAAIFAVVAVMTVACGGDAFAISIDTAKPIAQELIEKGRVERGYLGINMINITPSIAREYDLPVDSGVGIGSVQEASPADRAGLRAGDIIVRAAG